MWLSFALLSALLLGVRRVYEKRLTDRFGNFSLAFALQVFSIVPAFVLLFFLPVPKDMAHLSQLFWGPLLIIWVVIIPIQTYFLYRSLREGELSEVAPISALLPVFNIATSFFLIGELPTSYGIVGIALTVCATLLLLTDTEKGTRIAYNRPVLFMIISVACTALGSTLDKVAIDVSTPAFYSFVNIVGGAVVFLVFTYVYREEKQLKQIRELLPILSILGVVLALAFVSFTLAFADAPTSYVLAIRSAGFLLAAFWGIIFLGESLSRKKILSLAFFVLGTVLLSVG